LREDQRGEKNTDRCTGNDHLAGKFQTKGEQEGAETTSTTAQNSSATYTELVRLQKGGGGKEGTE